METAARLHSEAARLVRLGAWQCELPGNVLTWTDGVYDLFGLERGSTLHRPSIVDLYRDEARREMERRRAALLTSGRGFTLDAQIVTSRGEGRWMRLSAEAEIAHGRVIRIYGAKQDITQEKALWAGLEQLAYSDPLTGLANRRAFESRCEDVHRRDAELATLSALAVIDVDLFKQINDQHGHAAGDECLRQIGVRLRQALGDALMIARIGGDEFAALLRLPLGRPHLDLTLQHALRMLSCPVYWNGAPIEIGVSIGAAILKPSHRHDPPRLFAEADSALYLAKTAGRNQARVFADAIETKAGLAASSREDGPHMALAG